MGHVSWKRVVAGVDESPEGSCGAAAAWHFATTAGVGCLLAHVVPDSRIRTGRVPGVSDVTELRREVSRLARERLVAALGDAVPDAALETLEVHFGRTARVLTSMATHRDAGLIVVGGKRHSVLGRWLAGSTAHQTIRLADVPTLVATPSAGRVQRVLAAVDLSAAAWRTIEAAQWWGELFNAELRVMHVIEPLPFATELERVVDQPAYIDAATSMVKEVLWPRVTLPTAERVIRHGWARRTIEAEVAKWGADLLVVGTHGTNRFDRVVLGSVTEDLLNELPASILVVPLGEEHPARPEPPGEHLDNQPP